MNSILAMLSGYRSSIPHKIGNRLANGTYLYRVVMKDSTGKSYTSFEELEGSTDGDARRFFTKGIGKLVILR